MEKQIMEKEIMTFYVLGEIKASWSHFLLQFYFSTLVLPILK